RCNWSCQNRGVECGGNQIDHIRRQIDNRRTENADRVIGVVTDVVVAQAVEAGRDRMRIDLPFPKRPGTETQIVCGKRIHPVVHRTDLARVSRLAGYLDSWDIKRLRVDLTLDVEIAGKARNVVYAVTMHNWVYAFDADDLSLGAGPLWK